jgi:hypothetical protein
MKRIVLLGDSIIDNGAYVRSGEPDVARQLQERLPGATVVKRALDGAKVENVLRDQLNDLTSEDIIVLSVGGNNALEHVGLLEQSSKAKYLEVLNKLWTIRKGFEAQYRRLTERIAEKQPDPTKVTVMTIYDPCFVGSAYPEEYQKAAEAAVSMFNDVIQREAACMGYTVMELRELFTDKGTMPIPLSRQHRAATRSRRPWPSGREGCHDGDDRTDQSFHGWTWQHQIDLWQCPTTMIPKFGRPCYACPKRRGEDSHVCEGFGSCIGFAVDSWRQCRQLPNRASPDR